jgi:hypothetical protein
VDVEIHVVLPSAVAGAEWSASHPGRFTPRQTPPGTHWIGGWMDPRAGPDDLEKRKFLPPPVQSVASRYTDYAIQAPIYK